MLLNAVAAAEPAEAELAKLASDPDLAELTAKRLRKSLTAQGLTETLASEWLLELTAAKLSELTGESLAELLSALNEWLPAKGLSELLTESKLTNTDAAERAEHALASRESLDRGNGLDGTAARWSNAARYNASRHTGNSGKAGAR